MGSRDEKGSKKTERSKIVEQAKVRLGKKESDGSSVRGILGLFFLPVSERSRSGLYGCRTAR